MIYADFECFTKPMSSCCPNPENSYSYNYQKHEPSGFCLYIKGIDPNISFKPILYTKTNSTDDIPAIFLSKLAKVTNKIYNNFYCRPIPLKLTPSEQDSFDKAEICHICKKELLTDKVRDHCHFTGKYRGATHNSCNLKCRKGYIFEVDLEYPHDLWETHNDYPVAPERMIVNGVEKLICHVKPRKNYVVHYRNLRQYLEMGMKITAVHRGISFNQSPWMEPSLERILNLEKQQQTVLKKTFLNL